MANYASTEDVSTLFRALTTEETEKVEQLLPLISDQLRYEAAIRGRDLDQMIAEEPSLASVAKSVTVGVVARILRQNTTGEVMSQESQSALGYSWSGTYAIPGGGIAGAIMRNDLKMLGLMRPRYRATEIYDLPGGGCDHR